MKRIIALILCLLMSVACLFGCGVDKDEKGQKIPVYLSEQVTNLDPAYALLDDNGTQIVSMLFEGLTKIDENGKVVNAMAKSWKIIEEPEEDYYAIEVELKQTGWSDGRTVSADDFVFAWKRILEPEFNSSAAVMLFDIKNALDVKNGNGSIDDVGVYAAATDILTIEFTEPIDYDLFKEYCASPALVPLREDVVSKGADWGTNVSLLITNGPFTVRAFTPKKALTLERNAYYFRDAEKEEAFTKTITPHRVITEYVDADGNAVNFVEQFNNNEIFFMGSFSLEDRKTYAETATRLDMLSTHTYLFNTTRAPFDNAKVREALSLAIDRNAIVDIVTFAKPATGMIPEGVFETDRKTTFRSVGGELIASTANVDKAKSLLAEAGVSGGSFSITIRPIEADRAVAEYIAGVWGSLGFTVTVNELDLKSYRANDYDFQRDLYLEAYKAADFDVIAVDWQVLSTDAYTTLAPFAVEYSGGAMNLTILDENGEYQDDIPHITGYNSTEYNTLMGQIVELETREERAELLHQAETMLVADMPVMPIYVHQNAYIASDELKNIKNDSYFGTYSMNKLDLSTYDKYFVTETEPEVTYAEETVAE